MDIRIIKYLIGLLVSIIIGLITYSIRKMRKLSHTEIICGIILAFITWTIVFMIFISSDFRVYGFIKYRD